MFIRGLDVRGRNRLLHRELRQRDVQRDGVHAGWPDVHRERGVLRRAVHEWDVRSTQRDL
jgi:hypothetical protein